MKDYGHFSNTFFPNRRPAVPVLLYRNAAMLCLAIILSVSVFATDTWLHYATSTVEFDKSTGVSQPESHYGRGLNAYCLRFHRSDNGGFPCSYDPQGLDPDFVAQQNEVFRLQHNTSAVSQVQFVEDKTFAHGDLTILVPKTQSVQAGTDFRVSTIGVSSQCVPITSECNMRYSAGDQGLHTLFNCSKSFWGVLGKAPNVNDLNGDINIDPDVPPLGYKPAANLQ